MFKKSTDPTGLAVAIGVYVDDAGIIISYAIPYRANIVPAAKFALVK